MEAGSLDTLSRAAGEVAAKPTEGAALAPGYQFVGGKCMRSGVVTFGRARRLRRDMTKPEIVLWAHLRNHGVAGVHFRRQHALGPYILDFYCSALKLCIELDGISHATPEAARHDELRTSWLQGQGVRVVRFAAADVMREEGLVGVLGHIEALIRGDAGI